MEAYMLRQDGVGTENLSHMHVMVCYVMLCYVMLCCVM